MKSHEMWPSAGDLLASVLSEMSTVSHETDYEATLSANGRALSQAFACFREAAGSLQETYSQLKAEVAGLRHELEVTNLDLSRSLEENRRTRMHLNQILEGLPCAVLVREDCGPISVANPEARRLLGVEPNNFPSQPVETLLAQAWSNPGEIEFEVGEKRLWLSIRCTHLEGEERLFAVFIIQDVTEWRRFREDHEELKRKRALAEMSALLAHEVRNPLASMELFAGLLANSSMPDESRPWLRHLQAGLRSLSATVNNILQFHNAVNPQKVAIDLDEFLSDLRDFLLPVAEQAGVQIEMSHHLSGASVFGDPHAIRQVLLNLAMNAFHFMPGGGTLKIGGRVEIDEIETWTKIYLTDTGLGIAPEHLDLLFQPGFSTRPGSAGLGLAVCKSILDAHGGKVTAKCESPTGATFIVELPGAQT